jgi:hypothetical protein
MTTELGALDNAAAMQGMQPQMSRNHRVAQIPSENRTPARYSARGDLCAELDCWRLVRTSVRERSGDVARAMSNGKPMCRYLLTSTPRRWIASLGQEHPPERRVSDGTQN